MEDDRTANWLMIAVYPLGEENPRAIFGWFRNDATGRAFAQALVVNVPFDSDRTGGTYCVVPHPRLAFDAVDSHECCSELMAKRGYVPMPELLG